MPCECPSEFSGFLNKPDIDLLEDLGKLAYFKRPIFLKETFDWTSKSKSVHSNVFWFACNNRPRYKLLLTLRIYEQESVFYNWCKHNWAPICTTLSTKGILHIKNAVEQLT